jgi:NAD(P)-dependent dehydrogenase (short-subunit alcohol dehydrogenase family)
MGRLDGKIALIMGGGADGPPNPGEPLSIGNGRATAIMCAREGATVMAADLKLELAEQTAAAIRAEGGKAEAMAADVSKEEDCRSSIEGTVKRLGTLNLLVNNVGIAIGGSLLNTNADQFDRMYQVNLRSHFLMMRYAVPEMQKAGGGAIVNVSSLAALMAGSGIAYEATKAALLGLSRSVAVRYARDGIRVNTILPGLINSSMVRREWRRGFRWDAKGRRGKSRRRSCSYSRMTRPISRRRSCSSMAGCIRVKGSAVVRRRIEGVLDCIFTR